MIRPKKHSDPRFSVLNVGGYIITALKQKSSLTFDQLLSYLTEHLSEDVKEVYLSSLSFLYLLGKLEYYQESDSFKLVV